MKVKSLEQALEVLMIERSHPSTQFQAVELTRSV